MAVITDDLSFVLKTLRPHPLTSSTLTTSAGELAFSSDAGICARTAISAVQTNAEKIAVSSLSHTSTSQVTDQSLGHFSTVRVQFQDTDTKAVMNPISNVMIDNIEKCSKNVSMSDETTNSFEKLCEVVESTDQFSGSDETDDLLENGEDDEEIHESDIVTAEKRTRKSSNLPTSAHKDVLPVYCKNTYGELHKSKFGSGTRSRCIYTNGNWITPAEFEVYAGRGSCKDWKRTLTHCGIPLTRLIKEQVLRPHAVSCACMNCCPDTLTPDAPVKYFVPFKRKVRKRTALISGITPSSVINIKAKLPKMRLANLPTQVALQPAQLYSVIRKHGANQSTETDENTTESQLSSHIPVTNNTSPPNSSPPLLQFQALPKSAPLVSVSNNNRTCPVVITQSTEAAPSAASFVINGNKDLAWKKPNNYSSHDIPTIPRLRQPIPATALSRLTTRAAGDASSSSTSISSQRHVIPPSTPALAPAASLPHTAPLSTEQCQMDQLLRDLEQFAESLMEQTHELKDMISETRHMFDQQLRKQQPLSSQAQSVVAVVESSLKPVITTLGPSACKSTMSLPISEIGSSVTTTAVTSCVSNTIDNEIDAPLNLSRSATNNSQNSELGNNFTVKELLPDGSLKIVMPATLTPQGNLVISGNLQLSKAENL